MMYVLVKGEVLYNLTLVFWTISTVHKGNIFLTKYIGVVFGLLFH